MGFVKISYDLKEWGWISDPKTVYVYIRLMLDACWKETDYKGVHLKRGQALISQREYAAKIGVSYQELRTILSRLVSTHKITQSTTHKNTIVTLLEYDCDTQSSTQPQTEFPRSDNAAAAQSQRSDNPPTLLYKKDKNIRN